LKIIAGGLCRLFLRWKQGRRQSMERTLVYCYSRGIGKSCCCDDQINNTTKCAMDHLYLFSSLVKRGDKNICSVICLSRQQIQMISLFLRCIFRL